MNNNFRNGNGIQGQQKKPEQKTVNKTASQVQWDGLKDFFNNAIKATPVETIFEVGLLIAGALRTYDFLRTMGSSAALAISSLVYSEVGILVMEILHYRGRRMQSEKYDARNETTIKYYPRINQKSLSTMGIWLHIGLTVFFTASDIIKNALSQSLGAAYNLDVVFSWALGLVVAGGVLTDLIIVLNYKRTNPMFVHQEKMQQLEFDKVKYEMELEETELVEYLKHGRQNAGKFAEMRARMDMESSLVDRYGEKLGKEYVESQLKGSLNTESVRPQQPQQNRNPNSQITSQLPRSNNVPPMENTSSNPVPHFVPISKPAGQVKEENFQKPHQQEPTK